MDDSGEDRKYAIVVEGYAEPVGFTALYGLFRQTAPELGALIGDDVRGKGVGRRAEALTIKKASTSSAPTASTGGSRPATRSPRRPSPARAGSTRERCARTSPARGSRPTTASLGVLPDEFRAATADLFG